MHCICIDALLSVATKTYNLNDTRNNIMPSYIYLCLDAYDNKRAVALVVYGCICHTILDFTHDITP